MCATGESLRKIIAFTTAMLTFLIFLPRESVAQIGQHSPECQANVANDIATLMPVRMIRFTTDEGTWMSLDVSPDGRTIVFDLLGHLYTLPITGGRARRITSGMAYYRQPRYSPDGRQLVFVSDRNGSPNLWIADSNGENAWQLSNLCGHLYGAVSSPAWSPNGRTVVASQMLGATRKGALRTGQNRWLLASHDVLTGQMAWIVDTVSVFPYEYDAAAAHSRGAAAGAILGPAFGASDDIVYAAVDAFRPNEWMDVENWRIARVELRTGRILPEMGMNVGRTGMRPILSPDGRYLVYATSSGSKLGLRLRDLRSDRERWLVWEALDPPPSFLMAYDSRDLVPGYAFTPDSRAVIAAFGGKIHRIEIPSGRTSIIPFEAEVERSGGTPSLHQFGIRDTAMSTRIILHPALSPDGSRIAFSALNRIWILELSHSEESRRRVYRLTADTVGEFYPSWSPDGRWIAFSTWADGEGGAVRRAYVRHARSGDPRPAERLTNDRAIYFQTAVAPDGTCVVAARGALPADRMLTLSYEGPSDLNLVRIPTDGGLPHTIAPLPSDLYSSLRPLYFTRQVDRVYFGLTSWRWDGTAGQALERLGTYGRISPDELRALVMRHGTIIEIAQWPSHGRKRLRFISESSAAVRSWGVALAPWISYSHDGKRAAFNQGGTLFVGDVLSGGWTSFVPVKVPLTIPVDVPRGTLLLRGARLITMRDDEVIESGDLLVRDSRIVAVGRVGEIEMPDGTHVLDVTGKTILPGYVDLHDHLHLPNGIHPQQCWQCLVRLAYGVTAVRDPNPAGSVEVFAYRERERAHGLVGPRIFSTGPPAAALPRRDLDAAREAVRPHAEYFDSETLKIFPNRFSARTEWQLIATAAAEAGLNPTAHGQGAELGLALVTDGFTGLEHPFYIRTYDDVATLIARSGSTHTNTLNVILGAKNYMFRRHGNPCQAAKLRRFIPPSMRSDSARLCVNYMRGPWFGPPDLDNLASLASNVARVVEKGGRVAMGSHGDVAGLGYHFEMWLHSLGGMPSIEILRSATVVGAEAIGHGQNFGSLEPGKLADLQVLEQNPLKNIYYTTSIRYVMKNGRLYEADDLTEIWPLKRPLDTFYLWDRKEH